MLADLGLMPWDVLHQGLARLLGWSLGTVIIVVGVVVLLAWIPLRERPGVGTVANVVVVGLVADAVLAVVDPPSSLALRIALAAGGIPCNAVATAAYVGVRLGPGPRDGLMTGLVRRTGRPSGSVRTSHRGRRRRLRLAAGRHRRRRHRRLRPGHRPPRPAAAPPPDRPAAPDPTAS